MKIGGRVKLYQQLAVHPFLNSRITYDIIRASKVRHIQHIENSSPNFWKVYLWKTKSLKSQRCRCIISEFNFYQSVYMIRIFLTCTFPKYGTRKNKLGSPRDEEGNYGPWRRKLCQLLWIYLLHVSLCLYGNFSEYYAVCFFSSKTITIKNCRQFGIQDTKFEKTFYLFLIFFKFDS